jgi:hypothetical protein
MMNKANLNQEMFMTGPKSVKHHPNSLSGNAHACMHSNLNVYNFTALPEDNSKRTMFNSCIKALIHF